MKWLWHAGTPKAKERPRFSQASRRAYTPPGTRDEERLIGWEWRAKYADALPETGDVALWVVVIGGRGDIDNHVKLVLDALNGVAYVDDRQVKRVMADRLAPSGALPPGTYVEVSRMPPEWGNDLRLRIAETLAPVLVANGHGAAAPKA